MAVQQQLTTGVRQSAAVTTVCPDCGASLANVQGVLACAECRYVPLQDN